MIKAVIFDMYETLITHYNCPLYFGAEMARDANIRVDAFQSLWRPTESERSIGKMSFEEVIEMILKKNNCYSDELHKIIIKKRIATKQECFKNLHEEIIPMLEGLKRNNIKIGLISNCFSEEAIVIRESILFPYFDAVCLSYEEGIQKPNKEIFERCVNRLDIKMDECIYIGDGGSNELETSGELGMKPFQACWYFKDDVVYQVGRKEGFKHLEKPMDILNLI